MFSFFFSDASWSVRWSFKLYYHILSAFHCKHVITHCMMNLCSVSKSFYNTINNYCVETKLQQFSAVPLDGDTTFCKQQHPSKWINILCCHHTLLWIRSVINTVVFVFEPFIILILLNKNPLKCHQISTLKKVVFYHTVLIYQIVSSSK